MNELRRHAVRVRMNGFPIYDEDEVVGYVSEPMWQWGDLTAEQREEIGATARRLQDGRDLSEDAALSFALGEFGVECPHRWSLHIGGWRECAMCYVVETIVDGIVVELGDGLAVVPSPPPATWRVPRAPKVTVASYEAEPAHHVDVDEYRWDGSRYVKISPLGE